MSQEEIVFLLIRLLSREASRCAAGGAVGLRRFSSRAVEAGGRRARSRSSTRPGVIGSAGDYHAFLKLLLFARYLRCIRIYIHIFFSLQ